MSETLLSRYYEAFNRGDAEAMLGLLTEDVVHEPSQGEPRQGKAAFAAFLDHMNRCYKERVIDPVFLSSGTALARRPSSCWRANICRPTATCRPRVVSAIGYVSAPFSILSMAGSRESAIIITSPTG